MRSTPDQARPDGWEIGNLGARRSSAAAGTFFVEAPFLALSLSLSPWRFVLSVPISDPNAFGSSGKWPRMVTVQRPPNYSQQPSDQAPNPSDSQNTTLQVLYCAILAESMLPLPTLAFSIHFQYLLSLLFPIFV